MRLAYVQNPLQGAGGCGQWAVGKRAGRNFETMRPCYFVMNFVFTVVIR